MYKNMVQHTKHLTELLTLNDYGLFRYSAHNANMIRTKILFLHAL